MSDAQRGGWFVTDERRDSESEEKNRRDPTTTGATSGITEFLPFNEELNRFTLTVENAPADKCNVTWGAVSKVFSRDQMAKGINLAAEFLENPFSEPFRKVEAAIREQQNYETPLVKKLVTNLPEFKQLVPQETADIDNLAAGAIRRDQELFTSAAAAVTPVKHRLLIEAIQ